MHTQLEVAFDSALSSSLLHCPHLPLGVLVETRARVAAHFERGSWLAEVIQNVFHVSDASSLTADDLDVIDAAAGRLMRKN